MKKFFLTLSILFVLFAQGKFLGVDNDYYMVVVNGELFGVGNPYQVEVIPGDTVKVEFNINTDTGDLNYVIIAKGDTQ